MNCAANWLALCAALALGEACGFALSKFASLWPFAAATGLVATSAFHAFVGKGTRFSAVFFVGLILALIAAHSRSSAIEDATWHNTGKPFVHIFHVDGDGTALPGKGGISWTSFPASAGALKVRVIFPRQCRQPIPRKGESWECAGWLERMKVDDIARRRKFWVKGPNTYARMVKTPRGSLAARLSTLRETLSCRMGIGLNETETAANINRAILLGECSRLSADDRNAFVTAGTIHIFAISGLHVMLVAETIFFALALLRCPLRMTGLVLVPVLWLYVVMTGSSPSAVRAAAMASLHYLAPVFRRKPDGLVAWSLTFLAVYSLDPAKTYDIGCALSFSVMLGIFLWERFLGEFVKRRLLATLLMTFAIWAAGAPIAAHAFGRVTPGGMFANLILVPAAGISVKAAMLGLFASMFSESLAAHINNFAALVANGMSALSRAVATIPGANLEVAPWSIPACVAWYALFALLLVALRKIATARRRRI